MWDDFAGGRNKTVAASLLKHQKRVVGMIAEERGRYHSEPLFARYGMLKIEDLYRQQLRMHAWQFWNNLLPEGQTEMLHRATERHG